MSSNPKDELIQLVLEGAAGEGLSEPAIAQVVQIIKGEDSIELPFELVVENENITSDPESADPMTSPPLTPAAMPAATSSATDSPQSIPHPSSKTSPPDARSQISRAELPEKIKLAMFGNATCRALLIRDTNKLVQQFVLKNPRIQALEIEEFSKNPNLSEQVLRQIAQNQSWAKAYAVRSNLVFNPKTPIDISLKWIKYLNSSDIRRLSKTKNVSQVLVTAARKRLEEMATSKGGEG